MSFAGSSVALRQKQQNQQLQSTISGAGARQVTQQTDVPVPRSALFANIGVATAGTNENNVYVIGARSGEVTIDLALGVKYYRLPYITGDIDIIFENETPETDFNFALELDFVQIAEVDDDNVQTNPVAVTIAGAAELPMIEGLSGETDKLILTTVDSGENWTVTKEINLFDSVTLVGILDFIGGAVADFQDWIEELPTSTEGETGFFRIMEDDNVVIKIIKGIGFEGAIWLNSLAITLFGEENGTELVEFLTAFWDDPWTAIVDKAEDIFVAIADLLFGDGTGANLLTWVTGFFADPIKTIGTALFGAETYTGIVTFINNLKSDPWGTIAATLADVAGLLFGTSGEQIVTWVNGFFMDPVKTIGTALFGEETYAGIVTFINNLKSDPWGTIGATLTQIATTLFGTAGAVVAQWLTNFQANPWTTLGATIADVAGLLFGEEAGAAVAGALKSFGEWFNGLEGDSVAAKIAAAITITVTEGIQIAIDWVNQANVKIKAYIDSTWTWLKTGVSETIAELQAGLDAWLGDASSIIQGALGAAWTWLNGLADSVRDAISAFFTTTDTIIEGLQEAGATLTSAITTALFGPVTPSKFAEDEADGQITSALDGEGSIKTAIDSEIVQAFTDFGIGVGAAIDATHTALSQIIDDINTFFTGAGDTIGANRSLDNLDNVQIEKALTFKLNTNTTGSTNKPNLGFDATGQFYLKCPSTESQSFFQYGGADALYVNQYGITMPTSSNSDPSSNGEIKRVGNTIKVKVNGIVKDLALIGTGDGGGEEPNTRTTGLTPLTTSQTAADAFYLPIKEGSSSISTSALNTAFGSARYSCGILAPADVDATEASDVYFVFKTSGAWLGVQFNGVGFSSDTGSHYSSISYEKRSALGVSSSGSSATTYNLPAVLRQTGRWGFNEENGDSDDGGFWMIEGTNYAIVRRRDRDFGSSSPTGSQETRANDIVPSITTGTTATALEAVFGVDDGYVGYVTTGNRFYVKVNGHWFYMT